MCKKPIILVMLTFITFAFSINASAIQLGSIADSRFGTGWSLDGPEMTDTRAKLLNPANFGPEGTVQQSITITDVSAPITYTQLSNFDIFFIGYFRNTHSNAFSEDELTAMEDWVTAGGTMIITCDAQNYDAVCSYFGPTPGAVEPSLPVIPTAVGATRPPFNGPFGTPNELQMAGDITYFENTGGFSVLAEDQTGNPVILEALIGNGRVVTFTDVDIISNHTLSESDTITNHNDQFLGNLVAYLADEAGETFFINTGMMGNWWSGPERDGEGAQVDVFWNADVSTVFVTFYSYDTEGNQIFLVAIGPIFGSTASLDVFITEDGLWGNDFDPALVQDHAFGTGTISAGHCDELNLTITPNSSYEQQGFTEQSFEMIRLAQFPSIPCPLESR